MGIETALMIGFSALQAAGQISQAKSQAKAAVEQGNILAQNKARETAIKAARVQSSFLSSGLTLDGTPNNAIDDTFNTGIADIGQISSNYNNQAKNIMAQGRSAALSTMASSFSGMDFGSTASSSFINFGSRMPDSFAYGLNSAGFGNSAYSMLEMSDKRGGFY